VLNYFFTRHQLPVINTPASYPFTLESSAAYAGKTIPFDRIYVCSHPYFKRVKTSLGDEADKLVSLSEKSVDYINSDKRFPQELKSLNLSSKKKFKNEFSVKKSINIAVINGVGTGLGDNYVGLGLMQFMQKMVGSTKVAFHLMQNFSARTGPVYMHEKNVLIYSGCISVKQWFDMDYYIDLVGMLSFKGFDDLPLVNFYAKQFGIEKIIKNKGVLPSLHVDQRKSNTLSHYIKTCFSDQRPIVLLHPEASSPIRSMPNSVVDTLINNLVNQGFNVVSAVPHVHDSKNFCDISHLSVSIDDLVYIAKSVDAVISVGTVLYHLSAALSKPTWLLPTVKADIHSASAYEQVTVWLDDGAKKFISQKHKSRQDDDIKQANKVWKTLDTIELSKNIFTSLSKK